MTSREMVAEFQRLIIQSDPSLMDYGRLDVFLIYQFLNTAQDIIFKERYISSPNSLQNIEIINANIEEVKHLIKYIKIDNIDTVPNELYNKSYIININDPEYAHYIQSFTSLVRNIVFPTNNEIVVENILINYKDFNRYLTTSFHVPIIRKPGILIENDSKLLLVCDIYTTPKSLIFYYLKYPNRINDDNDCILSSSLHKIIVEQAVQLFRSNKYILNSSNSNKTGKE